MAHQSLATQSEIVERILQHIDNKTTQISDQVWREPTANYVSQSRYEAEITRVMRRTPTPFCPAAALPEAGSYVAREAALTPLVAVRGEDGVARVFRNACRHRGAQVVEGSGCKSALTCPYHAWTYGLDGALKGLPHEHGFPGIARSEHGLVPVTAVERHGIVFVTQDGPALGEAEDDVIPDLFGEEYRFIGVRTQDIAANWKIVTEGVLEGYHIRSTHSETFYPRQYDNLTLFEPFGRNTRMTFPYQAIERQRQRPASERETEGVLTHVYHLFPNAAVSTFPTHRSLTIFEPVAIDQMRIITYTMTTRPEDETSNTDVRKGRDFVALGADEDRRMQTAVQRGLATDANEYFTFGLFEGAIASLHQHLAEAISAS